MIGSNSHKDTSIDESKIFVATNANESKSLKLNKEISKISLLNIFDFKIINTDNLTLKDKKNSVINKNFEIIEKASNERKNYEIPQELDMDKNNEINNNTKIDNEIINEKNFIDSEKSPKLTANCQKSTFKVEVIDDCIKKHKSKDLLGNSSRDSHSNKNFTNCTNENTNRKELENNDLFLSIEVRSNKNNEYYENIEKGTLGKEKEMEKFEKGCKIPEDYTINFAPVRDKVNVKELERGVKKGISMEPDEPEESDKEELGSDLDDKNLDNILDISSEKSYILDETDRNYELEIRKTNLLDEKTRYTKKDIKNLTSKSSDSDSEYTKSVAKIYIERKKKEIISGNILLRFIKVITEILNPKELTNIGDENFLENLLLDRELVDFINYEFIEVEEKKLLLNKNKSCYSLEKNIFINNSTNCQSAVDKPECKKDSESSLELYYENDFKKFDLEIRKKHSNEKFLIKEKHIKHINDLKSFENRSENDFHFNKNKEFINTRVFEKNKDNEKNSDNKRISDKHNDRNLAKYIETNLSDINENFIHKNIEFLDKNSRYYKNNIQENYICRNNKNDYNNHRFPDKNHVQFQYLSQKTHQDIDKINKDENPNRTKNKDFMDSDMEMNFLFNNFVNSLATEKVNENKFLHKAILSRKKHQFKTNNDTIRESNLNYRNKYENDHNYSQRFDIKCKNYNFSSGDSFRWSEIIRQSEEKEYTSRKNEVLFRTRNRPFRCKITGCNKSYTSAYGLKYHESNGHNKEPDLTKPFQCEHPDCDKRYKNPNGLKYHMETRHP